MRDATARPAVLGHAIHGSAEMLTAVALIALLGAGALLGLAGAPTDNIALMAGGGAAAALALAVLLAAGWIEAPLVVALAVPLPALYASASLRIAAAAPITAIAVGAWILQLGVTGRPVATGRLPARTFVLLTGSFVLATLLAQHPTVSLRELLNIAVLFLFLIASIDAFNRDARSFPRVVRLLVAVGAIAGVLAVLEALTVIPGEFPRYNTAFNRAALGFGQPNGLGLFFAILLPFALHERRRAHTRAARALAAAMLACVTAGLIATFSRGSWLAVLAGTLVLAFAGERRTVVRIWIGAIITAVLVDVVSGGLIRDTAARTIGDWVIEQRAALMAAGVLMFLAYPVTGVGPGGYAESLDEFGPQIPQLWDYLPTPHNAYVQMAAETGLFGLLAFLAFFGTLLVTQVRRVRALPVADAESRSLQLATLWSLATVCAAGMVVWPFAHGTGQAVMLVIAGAVAVPAAADRAMAGPGTHRKVGA